MKVMDNQNQTTNNQIPQVQDNTVGIDSGYLVSEQVNPNYISKDQLNSDLEALKNAEAIVHSDTTLPKQEATEESYEEFDPNKSQVAAALELKNPFRGE